MLDYVINNPNLDKYIATFETGQTVFLEGDDSQDLYILVEGKAGILKGTKRIAEISDEGSVFGEMSFLLGENRTATVKAVTDLKVIKIPKEEVSTFLSEFPEVVREFARYLAKRLDETSQIVFGLKEFCDKLPDAVILTDKDGKIISWNRAAEKLYGREEDQMRYKSAAEIYEDPEEYGRFLEEVISKYAVSEKTLRIRHPKEGIRQVSTSTTVLYDGQHNFQGVLSLGRDATHAETVARRYQRVRHWFIPLFALLVMLGAGIFFGYPYFSKGYKITDAQKQDLKDDLAVNYRLLRSLLLEPFEAEDRQKTTDVMKGFFDVQKGVKIPFTGLVLLGKDKRVFNAYSRLPGVDGTKMIGSSYSGIDLGENKDARYKVLTLYREHKDHPMGIRHTEIVFRLYEDDNFIGWLIFQVDMSLFKDKYNADEKDLKNFRFEDFKEDAG
ncbi:MAG: cyclic nucleotide-binding domain-containing protein [Deltaproteobacteria bacterium]|jgi:PAS domain S-box-containing protein|nr:cyclic nucleotide-binding domain-containing protein [Deltaproteobacteria bacterium]